MSLINEALKKAQRQRTEDAANTPPVPGGTSGTRPGKRGRAMPAQTLLLIVTGAAILVVLSVVATIFLLRSSPATPPTEPPPEAIAKTTPSAPTEAPLSTEPTAKPVVVLPEIIPPVAETPSPKPEPVAAAEKVTAEKKPPTAITEVPVESPPPVPDERIYAFVDQLQVMGIRSSGSDSKVLMNDRVYRVNDIVDRTLGLKLLKVAPDSLTFIDPSGATYTKNF